MTTDQTEKSGMLTTKQEEGAVAHWKVRRDALMRILSRPNTERQRDDLASWAEQHGLAAINTLAFAHPASSGWREEAARVGLDLEALERAFDGFMSTYRRRYGTTNSIRANAPLREEVRDLNATVLNLIALAKEQG